MISRRLAFPAGTQKSILKKGGHALPRKQFNLEKKSSLDRDARAFIEKAGIKNGQGRQQISDYVRGLKALGWWGLVVSFPLRFHQNSESGTTLYGLGKDFEGEEFSATITGTLTRTTSGLVSPDPGNYLYLNRHAIADLTFWIGGCARLSSGAGLYGELFEQADSVMKISGYGSSGNVELYVYPQDLGDSGSDIPILTGFTSAPGFFQFIGNGDQFFSKKNTESRSEATFMETSIERSESAGIGNVRGTMPFFFFASAITPGNDEQNKFYSLYKSTLGQGLGLP